MATAPPAPSPAPAPAPVVLPTLDPVTLEDLTVATVDGTGVFDVLMRATKAHLEQEFKLGRIKGTEYSTVYLGSLQAVLQSAITFLLEKDKNALEAQLLAQQILNAEKEREVLEAQICKLKAEYDVIMLQKDKTAEERNLLIWKTNTEKAQTQGAGVDENSVIGKQRNLYQAQKDGFERDAEQKAAKLLVDTWTVRRTTDSGTEAKAENSLSDGHIKRAVDKVLQGVGA